MTVTESTPPAFAGVFTADDLHRLAAVPDEEQRSVLYRHLLIEHGIPDVVTDLSVAENVLLYEKMSQDVFRAMPPLPEPYIKYFPSYGTDELRRLTAGKLAETLHPDLSWQDVFGVAGVSSALQSIAWGLQTPLPGGSVDGVPVPRGTTVLLPAPFWQGFYWSFQQGPGLTCKPVSVVKENGGGIAFELTLKDLQRAYEQSSPEPRLLVLTNPHNPLGVNYDRGLLESIYEWALRDTGMHVISDEIYCHSQLPNVTPAFVSALALNAVKGYEQRVHVVWGFAKDFGLSGFRTGFVISKSPYVQNVMRGSSDPADRRAPQSWLTPFDSLKHYFILSLLKADSGRFWDDVMREYRQKLHDAFRQVKTVLDSRNIPYVHDENANSAQFFWLDLRRFLENGNGSPSLVLFNGLSPSVDSPEQQLAKDIHDNAKVKLLTGATLSCPVPGFFRLCFTAYDTPTVVNAVTRMAEYLQHRPATHPATLTA